MSRPAIIVCGATGRTGNAVVHALAAGDELAIAACVAPSVATGPTRPLPDGVPAYATLTEAFDAGVEATVLVDFTHADPALVQMQAAVDHGLHAVVGVTGFMPGQLESFGDRFADAGLGLLHVPNFSLGAVLAMQLAGQVAARFADVEVVETHHDAKRDAPSGTAVRTARLIAKARSDAGLQPGAGASSAGAGGGRGESIDGVAVHALRLPGATAHQEVVFGAPGELLTIRHDAIDRSCYAAGVALAARRVHELRGLKTGLESVL